MGTSRLGVGEALRLERLRQKKSIEDIARETRISTRMLEAIERDDFESLPGLLFARNFVKQYALALHMDPAPLVAEMPAPNVLATALPDLPVRATPERGWDPAWSGAVSSIAWLVLALTAAVLAYVHFNRPLENQVRATQTAARPADTGPAPEPASLPPAAEPAAVPRAVVPAESAPAVPAADRHPLRAPAAVDETAPVRRVNVSITAYADSWIQVSSEGKTLFEGTLKPNESKQFSADESLKLIAGNAGGISVSLNGRTLDPLGASGQVKVLRLTAEGPQAALAKPPDPDRL